MQRETRANTEGLFRIIQSIPSPKAETFKGWLAQLGYEGVKEIENPELASARDNDSSGRDKHRRKSTPIAAEVGGLSVVQAGSKQLHLAAIGVGPHIDLERFFLVVDHHHPLARRDQGLRHIGQLTDLRPGLGGQLVAAVGGFGAKAAQGFEEILFALSPLRIGVVGGQQPRLGHHAGQHRLGVR